MARVRLHHRSHGQGSHPETFMSPEPIYELLVGGRVVRIVGWGGTTVAEAVETLNAVLADPGLQSCFGILLDARCASAYLTADEVRAMALAECKLCKDRVRRTAVLAARDAQYGVGRMMQAHAERLGVNMLVATEEAKALAWLQQGLAQE